MCFSKHLLYWHVLINHCCTAGFCWKYQYNKYICVCLILSIIYIFIPVSGCVGRASVYCCARGPIALLRRLCPGAYNAVKTALPVPSQESEWSCICELEVSIFSLFLRFSDWILILFQQFSNFFSHFNTCNGTMQNIYKF